MAGRTITAAMSKDRAAGLGLPWLAEIGGQGDALILRVHGQ